MKRLLLILCLVATPAFAEEQFGDVAVSDSTPTRIPVTQCTTCRTLLVENGDTSDAIYCGPSASVTTDTGFKVSAADGWRSFPYRANFYCISANDAQTGTARNQTLFWAVED